ncbi:protein of unknown function [Taphrina deformans PYCC 5710]|uniref:Major facilitator superfamily (MFS) profile domain-containing protein n=1 Tax=Taphrina deformans (strain PYCC 5710 / ATCC 11124 / CBS 356.35 / IMI 108563 / JCM 9778 / NBRC 8474) TaxID=1097556 RepID=R4XIF3_TAPDE|nr:protein of unknown function [Taphrina deformans PYCC 5710]|eukprot:CCG84284.1 protein of unknown function [Taphrina deformans PYCC 5710]
MAKEGRPDLSLGREIALVVTISFAQLLTQAGLSQAISIQSIIGSSFKVTNPGVLSWFAAGYSLTVGTFILLSGRAGDLYGHKRLFVFGFAWFSIWSIVCGLTRYTSSSVFFIIARVFQGIGPAIVLPNGLAILGRTYPPSGRKNLVFSIFGSTAPSGSNVGAVFASLFAQNVNWSWAFYLMAIICFLVVLVAIVVIPQDSQNANGPGHNSRPFSDVAQQLDLWASIAGIAGLVLFNVAWNQGPVVGWGRAYIIVIFLLSFVFMTGFALLEARVSKYPLVPKEMFNIQISLILGCIATGWASFGIWFYYGWLFLRLQRGGSALLVAAQFTPTTVSGLVAALIVAIFLRRIGAGWIMVMSMAGFLLGNLFFSIAPIAQTYWGLTFVAMCVTPFGMDMSFPAANVIISDFVPHDKQGNAASLVNTILNYSISIGLGIAGTVEVQLNRGGTNQSDLLRGYRAAWRVGIGLAALGLALAVLLTYLIKRADDQTRRTDKESDHIRDKPRTEDATDDESRSSNG